MRIKIYPPIDFLNAFLNTRIGLEIVETRPETLHYTGSDKKELLKLIKIDQPDLVVMHEIPLLDPSSSVNWIYHRTKSEKDLYVRKKIFTNCFPLAQLYYQRLGIDATIRMLPRKKPELKSESIFVSKLLKIVKKFKDFMFWD